MNHGCVTLDEVFAAAAARSASLVPETSGYLALALGDATSRLPLLHDDRALLLTTEGSLSASRRGDVVSPERAARAMRDVLARLLAVSSGTMPGLAAAARPRDESPRGVDAVIEEIEAALIPVNRAAARRALARLAREALRAKEAGKLKPRREASVRPLPHPAVATSVAAPIVVAAPVAVVAPLVVAAPIAVAAPIVVEVRDVFTEPPMISPEPPMTSPEPPMTSPEPPVASPDPSTAFPDAQVAVLDAQAEHLDESAAISAVTAAPVPAEEAVTVVPEEQIVVAYTPVVVEALTPSAPLSSPLPRYEVKRPDEPTPTTLGMAIEIDEANTPIAVMALVHATVLGTASLVEEHPAAALEAPLFEIPAILSPSEARPIGPTRADDLLAAFAVSCSDDAARREATDGLKQLAGLDPTPPPLAVAAPAPATAPAQGTVTAPAHAPVAASKQVARPTFVQAEITTAPRAARVILAPAPLPEPKAAPALEALRGELEEEGAAPRRRSRGGIPLVAALLAGAVVGLVAVTRLRPDLVTSFEERVSPAAPLAPARPR